MNDITFDLGNRSITDLEAQFTAKGGKMDATTFSIDGVSGTYTIVGTVVTLTVTHHPFFEPVALIRQGVLNYLKG